MIACYGAVTGSREVVVPRLQPRLEILLSKDSHLCLETRPESRSEQSQFHPRKGPSPGVRSFSHLRRFQRSVENGHVGHLTAPCATGPCTLALRTVRASRKASLPPLPDVGAAVQPLYGKAQAFDSPKIGDARHENAPKEPVPRVPLRGGQPSTSQLHPEGEGRLLHAPRVRNAVQAVRTPDTILPDNIFKDGVPDLTTYGN